MSGKITSHGVNKLKELLFDSEAEHLANLSQRLEALAADHENLRAAMAERAQADESARAALGERLDTVYDRAGSSERFSHAVADVLDEAIERTERTRHDQLKTALAPAIVQTVKTEIVNSREELVEALYPMTGQMVKAYVASAMKDLVNQVNRRLESNALMLRIKSITTGRSMAELALAESQRLDVEELLLIRRGTGELIARWPQKQGSSNHDHVMGGVLTAINSFATEALEPDENNLRQIDLGASQVYLRSSPTYMLAAKCSGTAGASIERAIDAEFLTTVADLQNGNGAKGSADETIATLGPRLNARIEKQYEILDRPALGVSPFKLLLVLVGLPLLAWFGWQSYISYETNRVRETARQIIATSPEIQGYPTTLSVTPRGRELTITGLAPNETALQTVLDRLSGALPATAIDSQVAVVPQGAIDRKPEIAELRRQLATLNSELPRREARREVSRALTSADLALRSAAAHLDRLAGLGATSDSTATQQLSKAGNDMRPVLSAAISSVASAAADLRDNGAAQAGTDKTATDLIARADTLEQRISALARQAALTGVEAAAPPAPAMTDKDRPPQVLAAERLTALAQRLQIIAVALVQAELTRAAIPKPPPPAVVPPPVAPTPLERLVTFTWTNAIFFSDKLDFRDETVAEATLDEIAQLIRDAGVLVRVVGYTDERGSTARNSSLSQLRADKVRDALLARGVPAAQLVAIGRMSAIDISTTIGSQSPNRRVEFEIGFRGEAGP